MSANEENPWRELFLKWPATLPKRGVLVSTLNESTPFKSFMVKDAMVLLERTNPDPLGARYIIVGYDAIHMVKLVDPLKEEVVKAAGFSGHLAKA